LFCYGFPFIPHKNRPDVIFLFSSCQSPQFLDLAGSFHTFFTVVVFLRKNEELNNHYAVYVGDASGCIPGGEIPLHFLNYNLTGFRSALFLEAGSGSASKFRSLQGSKWSRGGPWTLKMEAWRLNMEALRVCRPVFADLHPFVEEQDPDPH
jgi:hypothetical protein